MANSENLMNVSAAYDAVAETYATVLPDTSFEAPLDMAMVDHFIAHMRATADRVVIDAGCGAGRMTSYLDHAGLHVGGVDLSPGMVGAARRRHPGLRFETGELTDLPAADATADGILAWYSIIHSPPTALPAIAREFWRVLRPGGAALIAFHSGSGHRTIDRAYGHNVELRAELHTPDDVALRCTDQGFVMRAQLVRSPRSVETHHQAAILVDKPLAPSL